MNALIERWQPPPKIITMSHHYHPVLGRSGVGGGEDLCGVVLLWKGRGTEGRGKREKKVLLLLLPPMPRLPAAAATFA